uniref:ATP-grasp domain-containing protein n=1 Tax=viral metagenome TaxID=1070528 RepID=A0A6M3LRT8_9ZZZZ
MKKFVRIRTRNSTARPLRRSILVDDWAVCRLGSLTATEDCFDTPRKVTEVNTVDAIQNSRSKLRMKECFAEKKVPQADAWTYCGQIYGDDQYRYSMNRLQFTDRDLAPTNISELSYPLVAKRVFGFQGRGMRLLSNVGEMRNFIDSHNDLSGWLFEVHHNYSREYRLHVGKGVGVFLSWRKLRRRNATERWFFNSENCEWYGEQHGLFDKPKVWKAMCKAARDALSSTGLEIGAVDIRVQSNTQDDPKFIVCEINSAPALAELGIELYKDVIRKIINKKKNA